MLKQMTALVGLAMIAGSAFTSLVHADIETMGPGGGDPGNPGFNCYSVFKDSLDHTNGLVPVGGTITYRVHLKALCNLPRARFTDYLPPGTTLLASSPTAPACVATPTPTSTRLDCLALNVHAGAEAVVYLLVRVNTPANRTIWNQGCFSDDILGGYACHTIHHFVTPAPSTPPPTPLPVRPEEPTLPPGSFFEHS